MIKKTTILFTFIALIFSVNPINSQSFNDLSNINFSQVSDSELDLLLRRASSQGYTQFDLLKIARAQGLTQSEIEKLDKRFKSAETVAYVAENASTPLEETRLRKRWQEEMEVYRELKSDIYGFEVFRGNTFLSFQSNLNLPTPKDYILGPGDKLFIDIYGQSENYYQAEVSPDGDLILENFGPINVSGLTVENSKKRLISRLKKVYTGINENKTFVNISVGIPRAVRVNIVGEGEKLIEDSSSESIIIRTSWLYSNYKNNFVKTIINKGNNNEKLYVVNDQFGCPTYAKDLVNVILHIIQSEIKPKYKIYNFSNEGFTNWYDFAKKILQLKKINSLIIPVNSENYRTVAKRPRYSVTDKSRIKDIFNVNIRNWEEALEEFIFNYK